MGERSPTILISMVALNENRPKGRDNIWVGPVPAVALTGCSMIIIVKCNLHGHDWVSPAVFVARSLMPLVNILSAWLMMSLC